MFIESAGSTVASLKKIIIIIIITLLFIINEMKSILAASVYSLEKLSCRNSS